MFWKSRKPSAAERKILDLVAQCEALRRQIRVLEAERDALADVIARDRERVKAETAELARRVAVAEREG
ncbi:MAG: hypothetical protein SH850_25790 [Planctomycetaceae bacterium]|nr:hypothetical protein [Planctomycetaceae bacterium]